MTSTRTLCQIILFGFAAACIAPASAALRMSVTIDARSVPNPGAKGPADSRRELDLVLGDTFISTTSGDETTVYDFGRRRRLLIDARSKTYADYSLYDVVGFRSMELGNREGIAKMLATIKTGQKALSAVESEHELSLQRPPGSPVEKILDGADEVFASAGVTLLRRGAQSTPVSAADADRFVKFLRYTVGGHPAILTQLQQEQRIPAHLTFSFHPAWGSQTVEVTVSAPRTVDAPAAFALDGYAPRVAGAGGDRLDGLVERAWNGVAATSAGDRRKEGDAIAVAFREHRLLDVFLSMMEQQIAGNGLPPPFSDEQKAQLQADPAVRQLSQALGPKDPNGLRQAIVTLQVLRPQSQLKRYMLELFEAIDRGLLGEFPEARWLFADVLQANPGLAGAYKDLGDLYFRSFDMPHAWRCWDIGRRLAPLIPTLAPITRLEQSLAAQFPEYF